MFKDCVFFSSHSWIGPHVLCRYFHRGKTERQTHSKNLACFAFQKGCFALICLLLASVCLAADLLFYARLRKIFFYIRSIYAACPNIILYAHATTTALNVDAVKLLHFWAVINVWICHVLFENFDKLDCHFMRRTGKTRLLPFINAKAVITCSPMLILLIS